MTLIVPKNPNLITQKKGLTLWGAFAESVVIIQLKIEGRSLQLRLRRVLEHLGVHVLSVIRTAGDGQIGQWENHSPGKSRNKLTSSQAQRILKMCKIVPSGSQWILGPEIRRFNQLPAPRVTPSRIRFHVLGVGTQRILEFRLALHQVRPHHLAFQWRVLFTKKISTATAGTPNETSVSRDPRRRTVLRTSFGGRKTHTHKDVCTHEFSTSASDLGSRMKGSREKRCSKHPYFTCFFGEFILGESTLLSYPNQNQMNYRL